MALPILAGLAKGALVVGKGAMAGGKAGAMAAAKAGAKGAAKGALKKAVTGGGRKMATKITNRSSGSRGGALVKSPRSKMVKAGPAGSFSSSDINIILTSILKTSKSINKTLEGLVKQKKKEQKFEETQRRNENKRNKQIGSKLLGAAAVGKSALMGMPGMGSIMNFFIQIFLGSLVMFIVNNIDEIVRIITQVYETLKTVFEFLDEYFFQPLMTAFMWIAETGYNLIKDFLKLPPIKWAVNELEYQLKQMGIDTEAVKNALMQLDSKLAEGFENYKSQADSFSGGGGAGGGARGFAGGGAATFDTIAGGEGGYNSVNQGTAGDTPGGAKSLFGKDLTEMTVGEIADAQSAGTVFAVGKYQIVPTTMLEWIAHPEGGVSRTDKFDAATQEKFKDYVINIKRPAIGQYLRGETSDPTEAAQAIAREFASVGLQYNEAGRSRGQSRYAGIGGNRASISPEEIMEALKADRAAGSVPQRMTPPSEISGMGRPSGGGDGQAYGTGLVTGPSAHIGGSTEYHIDTKLKSSLSMEDTVAYFDQMARSYEQQGRTIEFSNTAVAGARYKSTMSMQEKQDLLRRAAGAHASRPGYRAFDYYIPLESARDREHHSVEGAEIYVPTSPGGRVDYHTGGRYGNFVIMYDADGNEIGRTGHGDNRYGRSSGSVRFDRSQVRPPSEEVSQRTSYERTSRPVIVGSPPPSRQIASAGGGGSGGYSGGGQSGSEMSNTYLKAIMINNMYRIG